MPILATSVVMDAEDFLHPEGPQLGSPKYSVPSPPLPNAIESQLFSSNPWSFSQTPQYNQYSYPMQQSGRQFQVNPSSVDEFSSFPDVDFSDLTSGRNEEFAPVSSSLISVSHCFLFDRLRAV
ncbi:hypothetical protein PDJAM_G00127020 [Pangasius djambal]|uniref:Uncharacterized protein n=1 Tax=Pangasius djambal TaxID=1691987 RepID=A0ACC5ZAT8_9TELE|nr:hypothetical protein [Pangasius djambal]